MSRRSNVLLSAACLLLAALPALAKTTPKVTPKAVPNEEAVIENSGSTNTSGYKITVISTPGGYRMTSVSNNGNDHNSRMGNSGPIEDAVRKLFADLAAAMPLTGLTVHHGMRSVSFGTRTHITYQGQKSPDLTFGGDAHVTALQADIAAIAQALHVSSAPRHPLAMPVTPPPGK